METSQSSVKGQVDIDNPNKPSMVSHHISKLKWKSLHKEKKIDNANKNVATAMVLI